MAREMSYVLQGIEFHWIRWPMFVLFVSCFTWICVPFWIAVFGFILLLFKIDPLVFEKQLPLKPAATKLKNRTAVIVPVYNEPTADVFASLVATYDNLQLCPEGEYFDFYFLSDTRSEEVAKREIELFSIVRKEGRNRIFYRRRKDNVGRKSGNIEDFVERWGSHYESMVVLDADSVMSADTIIKLAQLMETNPQAAIMQTPPAVVFGETLFARLIQFSARLYGRLFSYGAAFWYGASSNYWGHNAIIRISAFREHCGLGDLPGEPPFGGAILSHDFVEAALLRAAGWGVYLIPNLESSYEQIPPTPIEYLQRDKRWSQGNLQHLKLLFRPHLTVSSRSFFVLGALAYISSPLWLLLLLFSTLDTVLEALIPHEYYLQPYQLFPTWPISREEDAFILFSLTAVVLLAPKLGAVLITLADKNAKKGFGGTWPLIKSVFCETFFFMLFAPMMMMFHTRFVVITLLGKVVPWNPQNRSSQGLTFKHALKITAWISAVAVVWIAVVLLAEPQEIYWMSPVLFGMLLAPLLVWFSSSFKIGQKAYLSKFFLTPEEVSPPPLLTQVRANATRFSHAFVSELQEENFTPIEIPMDMPINPIFRRSVIQVKQKNLPNR